MRQKNFLLAVIFLTLSTAAIAGPRSLTQAKAIAADFTAAQGSFGNISAEQFTLADASNEAKSISGKAPTPAYYILNVDGGQRGYVIVSGDDRFKEVLGYSNTGSFDAENQPDGLKYWLSFLEKEMNAAAAYFDANGITAAPAKVRKVQANSVEPLLSSHYAQGAPFNQQIPIQGPLQEPYEGKAAVGCVALGAAQIMNFWKYPATGQGGSYTNANNSQYTVNFDEQTYDWDLILDNYGTYLVGSGDPEQYDDYREEEFNDAQAAEIAKLCYHLGVATDMTWNVRNSGESSTAGCKALSALTRNFGYNPYAYVQQRTPISDEEFQQLLCDELAAGRPIMYSGTDDSNENLGGHFFVLDGYDATSGFFHINWGWQGVYNGYYTLSSLEPGIGGIGAGNGRYNDSQSAIIGIQPTELELPYQPAISCKESYINEAETPCNVQVLVHLDGISHDDPKFTSKQFGVAVYSLEDGSIKAENISNVNFTAGASGNVSLPTPHFLDLEEGRYIMKAVVKDNDGTYYPIHAAYNTAECWIVDITAGHPGTASFTAIDDTDPIFTGIADAPVSTNAPVNTAYYTVSGTPATINAKGVLIRKTTYTDGSAKTEKVIK